MIYWNCYVCVNLMSIVHCSVYSSWFLCMVYIECFRGCHNKPKKRGRHASWLGVLTPVPNYLSLFKNWVLKYEDYHHGHEIIMERQSTLQIFMEFYLAEGWNLKWNVHINFVCPFVLTSGVIEVPSDFLGFGFVRCLRKPYMSESIKASKESYSNNHTN